MVYVSGKFFGLTVKSKLNLAFFSTGHELRLQNLAFNSGKSVLSLKITILTSASVILTGAVPEIVKVAWSPETIGSGDIDTLRDVSVTEHG